MKHVAIGLLIALGSLQVSSAEAAVNTHQAYIAARAQQPSIRVLVAHDVPKAMLEVKGSYNIMDPNEDSILARRLYGKRRMLEPLYTGLKWGEEFPAVYQLQIVPTSAESVVVVDGVSYRGTVTFFDVGGTLSIVHELPIEEFVLSQLANQSGALAEEALAALAITARSQAYYMAEHPRNEFWAVDAMATGYQGDEIAEQAYDVQRAVQGTRYMVLMQPLAGPGAGIATVLPAKWSTEAVKEPRTLSVQTAANLATAGADAAKILSQAFPGASIQRIERK